MIGINPRFIFQRDVRIEIGAVFAEHLKAQSTTRKRQNGSIYEEVQPPHSGEHPAVKPASRYCLEVLVAQAERGQSVPPAQLGFLMPFYMMVV